VPPCAAVASVLTRQCSWLVTIGTIKLRYAKASIIIPPLPLPEENEAALRAEAEFS
jgi:hypothetical protein